MRPALLMRSMILAGMLLGPWLATSPVGLMFAGEAESPPQQDATTTAEIALAVQEGRVSLRARNASLKAILEEIGRRLAIEVMARIPADERVTLAFDQLSLAAALKRFRPYVNYAVVEDVVKGSGTIRKLIVVSKRLVGEPSNVTAKDGQASTPPERLQRPVPAEAPPTRSQPFSFEFDPSAVMERD